MVTALPTLASLPRQRGRPTKQPSLLDLLAQSVLAQQQESQSQQREALAACATDPVRFVTDYIAFPEGQALTDYQGDILSSIPAQKRIAVRSPHGAGKSATLALAVLWFSLTSDGLQRDWKVVTTAGAWRQLTKYLWPEIHKWARRLRWDKLGRAPFNRQTELLSLSLKLDYGEAFAVATDNPELIEGAHADRIFVVADEAKAIPAATFDAIEGALSGGGAEVAYAAAISTPNATSGRFREFWTRRSQYADWHVRHVTAQEAIAAGRLDPVAMEDRKRQWGEQHPLYQIRMLGEFADDGTEGVIPLSWVEQAQQRWEQWEQWEQAGKPATPELPVTIGVDVARQGEDLTAIALKRGPVVESVQTFPKADTMETTGRVALLLQANPGALAVVDEIGVGAAVVDRLREQGYPVEAFNAAARAPGPDQTGELQFLNKRSYAWWRLRELLDPAQEGGATLVLPPDPVLLEDLCAPRWKPTSAGRIQIEDKDSIRKRLGRSPDVGEAVLHAVVGEGEESQVAFYY